VTTNSIARSVLVTGGTRGIGRAIAEALRDEGNSVTVTGTRPDGTAPDGCDYLEIDFSDRDASIAFADHVSERAFDILINNAGTNRVGPIDEYELEDFELVLRVNLMAPFMMCRAVIPGMKRRQWGRIVNISSLWGIVAKENRAAYGASKFGIDGMTASVAADVAEYGILANCIAPGFIKTDLSTRLLGEEGLAGLAAQVPLRRCGNVEEVAKLVAFLAGPENSYITGQNIVIDGGFIRSRG
jgi:NAD(P)-dependent dehydrogenase (short-subunit alcohol dehydrogenase family)